MVADGSHWIISTDSPGRSQPVSCVGQGAVFTLKLLYYRSTYELRVAVEVILLDAQGRLRKRCCALNYHLGRVRTLKGIEHIVA